MINMFRVAMARMAVLATDESGMSTVEYSNIMDYTSAGQSGHTARRFCLCATESLALIDLNCHRSRSSVDQNLIQRKAG